jgi:ABC-type multidrug transport system fused ATPase/permease subunit
MALLITGALPFMVFGSVLYYRNITGGNANASSHASGANQAVSDAFSSVRVIQAYNLQDYMIELYRRKTEVGNAAARKQAHVLGALMGYSQLSIFAVYGLIIWFGGLVRPMGLTQRMMADCPAC